MPLDCRCRKKQMFASKNKNFFASKKCMIFCWQIFASKNFKYNILALANAHTFLAYDPNSVNLAK